MPYSFEKWPIVAPSSPSLENWLTDMGNKWRNVWFLNQYGWKRLLLVTHYSSTLYLRTSFMNCSCINFYLVLCHLCEIRCWANNLYLAPTRGASVWMAVCINTIAWTGRHKHRHMDGQMDTCTLTYSTHTHKHTVPPYYWQKSGCARTQIFIQIIEQLVYEILTKTIPLKCWRIPIYPSYHLSSWSQVTTTGYNKPTTAIK